MRRGVVDFVQVEWGELGKFVGECAAPRCPRSGQRERGGGDSRRLPYSAKPNTARRASALTVLLVWIAAFRKVREGRAS